MEPAGEVAYFTTHQETDISCSRATKASGKAAPSLGLLLPWEAYPTRNLFCQPTVFVCSSPALPPPSTTECLPGGLPCPTLVGTLLIKWTKGDRIALAQEREEQGERRLASVEKGIFSLNASYGNTAEKNVIDSFTHLANFSFCSVELRGTKGPRRRKGAGEGRGAPRSNPTPPPLLFLGRSSLRRRRRRRRRG